MKSFNLMVITTIFFIACPMNAFEFKGIKSGMTSEEVSLITGSSGLSLTKEQAEDWLNKTGYMPSIGISEGVSFEYGHDKKLYSMTIKFAPPNMFLRSKARDGGRDLFYSEVCNDGVEVKRNNNYDSSQYIECRLLDSKELARSIKFYRDEYANLVLSD